MKCPNCGSTDCKKLTEIVKQGTAVTASKTSAAGISLDGSVGFGGAKTKGVSVTAAAKEAEFTAKESDGSWIGAFLVLVAMGLTYGVAVLNHQYTGWDWGWWYLAVWFFFFVLLMQTPLGKLSDRREERAKKEKEDYFKTWKCRSCGHQWVKS